MKTARALEHLNEYQKAAVLDESPVCMVNANVGSGKTTVLISKIQYLHEEKKVPYEDMVVLTFTNKAADEIRERLNAAGKQTEAQGQVQEEGQEMPQIGVQDLPWFGTFHGVCLRMLKELLPVESLGYTRDFLVMLPEEELEMALQLAAVSGLKIKYKNRLRKRLEAAMSIQQEEKKVSRYNDDIFPLVDLIRAEKKRQNKMTYLDLLENTSKLLEAAPFHPAWIIVDEVQDSDDIQMELLDRMKGPDTSLFVVGDPNQVIYSWRGSAVNIFIRIRERYGAKELSLPINYRSTGSILEAARYFLQQGDRIEGVREIGNKIVVKNHYDAFQEADYLSGKIRTLHQEGVALDSIAIFYRLQNQSKTLEDVFTREGIPFEVSQKHTLQEIPVLNWLIKVLRYVGNPADDTAGCGALSNKEYGEGLTDKKAMAAIAQFEKEPEKADGFSLLAGIHSLRQKLEAGAKMSPEQLYQELQLDHFLKPNVASYQKDRQYVMAFFEKMVHACAEHRLWSPSENVRAEDGISLGGIREFLNESALYGMVLEEPEAPGKDQKSDRDQNSDPKQHSDIGRVHLMTLHASKGLEFSHVFIIGVNYGLIPLQTRGFEGDEEERRLFFVGITRAEEYLELSYYTSPDQYRVSPGPSRYISMIPAKLVQNEAAGKPAEIDVQKRLQEIKKQILASRGEMEYLFPDEKKEQQNENQQIERPQKGNPKEQKQSKAGRIDETQSDEGQQGEVQTGANPATESSQRVNHSRYGKGTLIWEDTDSVRVLFDDYGEKEFLKMFCELERE